MLHYLWRRIAEKKGATQAQIPLAWILMQKLWIAPIPDTRKMQRFIKKNVATNSEWTMDDLKVLETTISQITIHGPRYPERVQKLIDR
jgi:aryl-alcohol dehydrogenase-like predicted oxidoreductase